MIRLINIINEIKIIPNITREMVEELWSELYQMETKINSTEDRWSIMNKYVKNYKKNAEGHLNLYEPYNNGISQIIKQNKLKQFYNDLLDFKNRLLKIKPLDEIKIIPKITPEMVLNLFDEKDELENIPKLTDIMNSMGWNLKYPSSINIFIKNLDEKKLKELYQKLIQL